MAKRICIDCGKPVQRLVTRCTECHLAMLAKRKASDAYRCECAICGKVFSMIPSHKKLSAKHYCSKACKSIGQAQTMKGRYVGENNPYWKGGVSRLPASTVYRFDKKCEYCGKEFNTGRKLTRFCSISCGNKFKQKDGGYTKGRKAHNRQSGPRTAVCIVCHEEFTKPRVNSSPKYCSHKCHSIHQKETQKGAHSPLWRGGIDRKPVPCEICGKVTMKKRTSKAKNFYCSRECKRKGYGLIYRGPKNPRWLGGVSAEPYTVEWNDALKATIRQRDNNECQLCGKTRAQSKRALDVHHINYDKKDMEHFNLITLCNRCHQKTNVNRNYWFAELMDVQAFNLIGEAGGK